MRGIPITDDQVPDGLRRVVLAGPDGDLTSTEVASLEVITGDGMMTSVWQLTDVERAAIAAGGVVVLVVWGLGHPPVALEACLPEQVRQVCS